MITLSFLLGVLTAAGVAYYYITQILVPGIGASSAPNWEAVFQSNGVNEETQAAEEQPIDYSNPFEDTVTEDEVSDEQYVNPFDVISE